jgi:glucosamine-6-phosphate deaminase
MPRCLRSFPSTSSAWASGKTGHLAFNDPPVADFDDPARVKKVALADECLQQQVNDGCFQSIAEVPKHALTLTVPVFRSAQRLSIHVPGARKAAAVRAMLEGPIGASCPASILRLHPNATLYLDPASAGGLSA